MISSTSKGGNPIEKVKSHQGEFSPTTDICFSLQSLDYHVIKHQFPLSVNSGLKTGGK